MHKNENDVEENAQPGSVGISPVFEGQEVGFVLCFHGEPEADRGYADGGPAEHVGDADEAGWLSVAAVGKRTEGQTYFCSQFQSCPAPM